ncbi:DUF134 domain-containing protein [Stygiobacter electus]|uniref:UPF0251 protein P0M35_05890 n=1 Tax=Stygiobacter electus TaxID=3032292 RepID=A0AAE3TCQ2_9BACT|nr:DUF134 domain-containing protein [Stygiobacter electus]MDF1611671.1 DUF134 domain-containing protein [Stygiobacter electus]
MLIIINMPRPKKHRHICCNPKANFFKPHGIPMCQLIKNKLNHDELETLRLADFEKLSHEEGAAQMKISRATFGRILEQARFIVADAIINGKAIQIELTNIMEEQNENCRCNR